MTLLTALRDIGDRTTDSVSGFGAPQGGDKRIWFRVFDELSQLRQMASEGSAHDIVALADVIVLYANAHDETTRTLWRGAYMAVREAIAGERGAV